MQKNLTVVTRLALSVLAALCLAAGVHAQDAAPRSPLGVPLTPPSADQGPASSDAAAPRTIATAPKGFADRAWGWLLETQSRLNRDMAGAVRNLKKDNPLAATAALIAIAFAYGVLHAAGPGHGKAVISSYVLSNEETMRRGVALSFLAALFQALSAILFVGILAIILKQTSIEMRATEATIETVSWGLVAVVGAILLWRQVAAIWANRTMSMHADNDHNHSHNHDHHDHGPGCACGHSHMPSPKDIQGAWSWKKALPLALSVGIRPCSGALLLLVFSLSQGMIWAGILGTFAMALGTALTVSALAAMAVGSRNWAERASGPASVWAERIHATAGLAGATLVFGLGSAFFLASLRGAGPL
ncbi:MAG: nickel/cobalt transporter [Hyphomicrobium sp.]